MVDPANITPVAGIPSTAGGAPTPTDVTTPAPAGPATSARPPAAAPVTPAGRLGAYAVHAFTASGVVCAFLATAELCSATPDPRVVFAWLALQVVIDALDGPLARALDVKRRVPHIDGRTIDDLVDYLTYTFVPLLLVWRMGWVPEPAGLWVAPAMVASLFGFSNAGAKDEARGFFLGFPSYWNIVALYLGPLHALAGPWPGGLIVAALTVLTVLPVRFVYPNLAPRPWRLPAVAGAAVWALLAAWIVVRYDAVPGWLLALSLIYPAFYVALSVHLDLTTRRDTPGIG